MTINMFTVEVDGEGISILPGIEIQRVEYSSDLSIPAVILGERDKPRFRDIIPVLGIDNSYSMVSKGTIQESAEGRPTINAEEEGENLVLLVRVKSPLTKGTSLISERAPLSEGEYYANDETHSHHREWLVSISPKGKGLIVDWGGYKWAIIPWAGSIVGLPLWELDVVPPLKGVLKGWSDQLLVSDSDEGDLS